MSKGSVSVEVGKVSNPRVLNITVVRNLTAGQRQQLKSEVDAVLSSKVNWVTVAFHNGNRVYDFERPIPKYLKLIFLRNVFCWYYMFKNKNSYDYVLQRHMMFDPFSLFFSWFFKNRITIHHCKEIEELKLIRSGWKGNVASAFERIAGKISAKRAKAIIGVTSEIARYQCKTYDVDKYCLFYPNGISLDDISLLADDRHTHEVHAAFVCGTFSSWHGLDLLIDSARKLKVLETKVFIHLIGQLSVEQEVLLSELESDVKFLVHGYLKKEEYLDVLAKCDFGIGSLALFRKGLSEASTLKVREYLAMGLPVIASEHHDAALPSEFEYFKSVPMKDFFSTLIALKLKSIQRYNVRDAAKPYIEKKFLLAKLYRELSSLK